MGAKMNLIIKINLDRKREVKLAKAASRLLEQLEFFGEDLGAHLTAEQELIAKLKKALQPYARLLVELREEQK